MANTVVTMTIDRVNLLNQPVKLNTAVTWDGRLLYCHVGVDPNDPEQILVAVNSKPHNELGPVHGAPFAKAIVKVSDTADKQPQAQTNSINGAFGEGGLDFYLRFDSAMAAGVIYVERLDAAAPLEAVIPVSILSTDGASPTKGHIHFIAVADDGDTDKPNKIVFLDQTISVPNYRDRNTATIITFDPSPQVQPQPPIEQFGPMGILIP